ncbi:hypothetical protein RvY_05674 [Ramazzottius varieornatus]|uniref:JmjC domain-containing protein n=1 Tax=Ramazzottius varieornatus TaxID=947166 RepID=A0A1D1V5L2_RAMVA|nr:hypothetical protein RvY_05674 [Ramazzottius varieornatus]
MGRFAAQEKSQVRGGTSRKPASYGGKSPMKQAKGRQVKPRRKRSSAKAIVEHGVCLEDGKFAYSVDEKIFDSKFDRPSNSCVNEMLPADFTVGRLIRTGFQQPLSFRKLPPHGMRIPKKLTPKIIADIVGLSTVVEVIDCSVQEGVRMTLGKFVEYFTNSGNPSSARTSRHTKREQVYNLIDLEVGHTALDNLIQAPAVVTAIDWATNLWPQDLFAPDDKSERRKTQYPKTQKYVLMSKAGSYTDFHIDFGGTSVWYHLVYGRKIFLLIPPTAKNHALYAQWAISGQHLSFLADEVDDCERIEVCATDTIIIPSGWIHAVYTLEDSLVVGGNFLHSLAGEMQINVMRMEKVLKVKKTIRYPFFHDLIWFATRRYTKVFRKLPSRVCSHEKKTVFAILQALQEDRESGTLALSLIADERISDKSRVFRKLQMVADQLTTLPDIDDEDTPLWLSSIKTEASSKQTTKPTMEVKPVLRNTSKKDASIQTDSADCSVERILTEECPTEHIQGSHSKQAPAPLTISIPIHPVPLDLDTPSPTHKGYIHVPGSVVPSEVSTYMQL